MMEARTMVSGRIKEEARRDLYAMRRANGDWFVLEDHDRLRVPLFHSSRHAMMARLRNVGMQLFEPVALDAQLFGEIKPAGASNVDFCLVNDPFASLKRSSTVGLAQLALLMPSSKEPGSLPDNGNGLHISAVRPTAQSEWWN
jgi:hypothetical protein